MLGILAKLNGCKTYIVCLVTILYNIIMAWNGTMDWNAAIKGCEEALMVATLRHGIAKVNTFPTLPTL